MQSRYYYLFLCLCLLILVTPVKTFAQGMTLNARILCVGYPPQNEPEGKFMCLELSLKNNLKEVKSFWIFSCTWWRSFLANNDQIHFCTKNCSANYPILIKLLPNDSICFNTILKAPDNELKDFRIGFIPLSEEELMYNLSPKKGTSDDDKRILWSNSLSYTVFSEPRGFDFSKFHR